MTLQPPAAPEQLLWQGRTIEVHYDADWGGMSELGPDRQIAHLELFVVDPERAPIPVTETGYRSHFLPHGNIEQAGGPVAYVQRWLDTEARTPAWLRMEAKWRQLDLFG